MPFRRSHTKSRRGCSTCKQRHVKCDERRPTCGPCRARETPCEYVGSPAVAASATTATTTSIGKPNDRSSSYRAATENPYPDWHKDELHYLSDVRALELQLMNRYSAVTYKSLCSKAAQDDYFWQRKVPDYALRYTFLLDGLFAMTAFEVASLKQSDSDNQAALYVEAAHAYQTRAVHTFRHQLGRIDEESFEPTLCFSLMLWVLALASAQFLPSSSPSSTSSPNDSSTTSPSTSQGETSMVSRTIIHFELLRGCDAVLTGQEDYITRNPYTRRLTRFSDLPLRALDAASETALGQLTLLNDRRITSDRHLQASYDARAEQVRHWRACRTALDLLRECISKCTTTTTTTTTSPETNNSTEVTDVDDTYQGYVLGWLNMAGEDYIGAIRAGDSVAVLVLMVWGVQVEKVSCQAWWMRGFGRGLVAEIAAGQQQQLQLQQRRTEEEDGPDGGDGQVVKDLIASAKRLVGDADETAVRPAAVVEGGEEEMS